MRVNVLWCRTTKINGSHLLEKIIMLFIYDQEIGNAEYAKRQGPPEQGVRRNQSNMWIELRRPRNLVI